MTSYHKWDVKNGFAYVLQFFSLIYYCLGGVQAVQNNTLQIVGVNTAATVYLQKVGLSYKTFGKLYGNKVYAF